MRRVSTEFARTLVTVEQARNVSSPGTDPSADVPKERLEIHRLNVCQLVARVTPNAVMLKHAVKEAVSSPAFWRIPAVPMPSAIPRPIVPTANVCRDSKATPTLDVRPSAADQTVSVPTRRPATPESASTPVSRIVPVSPMRSVCPTITCLSAAA